MRATEFRQMSAVELAGMGLPYVNAFMQSPDDATQNAQENVPFGYRVTWDSGCDDLPSTAIRIGQCRVRTGDFEFPIFAIPLSMAEARKQLAAEYQDAINKVERIRELINGKPRVRTHQIAKIIA